MRCTFISSDQMVVKRKTNKEATWILAEEITVFRMLALTQSDQLCWGAV